MGEVRVVGIRVEQPQNQPVLLLRESNGDRYLPIWIGQSEAAAIAPDSGVPLKSPQAMTGVSGGKAPSQSSRRPTCLRRAASAPGGQ